MYITGFRLFPCLGVTDHNNSQASESGLNQQDNKHTVQLTSTFSNFNHANMLPYTLTV